MKNEKPSSYSQILKSTSIFGGVQVIQIILQIIRSKFVAILLGPAGMGIVGLFTSTIALINSASSLGIGTSAVKNIAQARSSNDELLISNTIAVLKKIVIITGLLGFSFTFIFSSWLSEVTFGTAAYSSEFKWLSSILFTSHLTTSRNVLLQGFREIKLLAKSSLLGSLIGVITAIPIYYFYGQKGIVPVLIISALFSYLLAFAFSKKISFKKVYVNVTQVKTIGKDMVKMGVMISLSSVLGILSSYLLKIYISNISNIEAIGLYTVGFTIINTYVGMVFNAMASDYYPRLSESSKDVKRTNQTINEQAEVAIIILTPILLIFIVYIKYIIVLLYSSKFVEITLMVQIMAASILFKALTWSMGFLILSKGNSKAFFVNELTANIYMLVLNLISYKYFGLTGLGIALVVSYLLYTFQIYFYIHKKYHFTFDKKLITLFVIQQSLITLCFFIMYFNFHIISYIIGSLLILFSSVYSLKELNKRVDLKSALKKLKKTN